MTQLCSFPSIVLFPSQLLNDVNFGYEEGTFGCLMGERLGMISMYDMNIQGPPFCSTITHVNFFHQIIFVPLRKIFLSVLANIF